MWRATTVLEAIIRDYEFQSTPSVWRATPTRREPSSRRRNFNPRPPCGGRPSGSLEAGHSTTFQSTPSVWRATPTSFHGMASPRFQSTPSVWRATADVLTIDVSTEFQSTPSVWRATAAVRLEELAANISIHALRVEGDRAPARWPRSSPDFNPRPPCGGRRPARANPPHTTDFNPRPPCGGRRGASRIDREAFEISIHALRVEGDAVLRVRVAIRRNFNPRPPCGGRRRT